MNRILTLALAILVSFAAAAFVAWDLNPGHWSAWLRFGAAAVALFALWIWIGEDDGDTDELDG